MHYSFLVFLPFIQAAVTLGNYTDSNGQAVTSLGCYYDAGASNRTLNITIVPNAPNPNAMTPQACALACSNANYPVSGTEFGGECYCAGLYAIATLQPIANTTCSSICTGNASLYCGGGNALNVFSQTLLSQQITFTSPAVVALGMTYQGCSNLYNTFGLRSGYGGSTVGPAMTADACGTFCMAIGWPKSAIQGSGSSFTCWCYVGSVTYAYTSSSYCKNTAPGNSLQYVGDNNDLLFYNNNLPSSITPLYFGAISYTDTIGNQWSFSACYIDSVTNRQLSTQLPLAAVTIQNCLEACAAGGYTICGLENGNQCWAGNVLSSAANTMSFYPVPGGLSRYAGLGTNVAGCNMTCQNSSTTPCGASLQLQVYSVTLSAGLVANYTDYKGQNVSLYSCNSDNYTSSPLYRTLPTRANLNASTLTPQACSLSCSSMGMPYSGVEYGVECWCGATAPASATILPSYTCAKSLKCPGNSSLLCGNGGILLVYYATPPSSAFAVGSYLSPALGSILNLGCYPDTTSARALSNFVFNNAANNSAETCTTQCAGVGYPYAAVSAGSLCFCGSAAPVQSGAPVCNTSCTGNAKELCGGSSAALIYSASQLISPVIVSGLTAAGAISSADPLVTGNSFATTYSTAASYMACAQDSTANRVMSTKATSILYNQMTPQVCVDACTLLGMPYSGVEWGQECWCNAIRPTFSVASNPDCMMPCTGNSAYACGNGNRISLYYNGGVSTISYITSANSYSLQGCFADSIGSRTLRNKMSLNYATMTPAVCTAACASFGYYYAGVEYAGECWCDNSIQQGRTALASNATCGMPCSGQAGAYCGGGNAINIYYNSALIRSTLQTYTTTGAAPGITWNYKACWGEPAGGRGLPNPINNAAQYTVGSCLELGSAAGYNACGLEYGGECWCNTIAGNPGGGQIPESYCTTNGMVCKGNSLNYCGAGNVFSFYSTGSQSYTLM